MELYLELIEMRKKLTYIQDIMGIAILKNAPNTITVRIAHDRDLLHAVVTVLEVEVKNLSTPIRLNISETYLRNIMRLFSPEDGILINAFNDGLIECLIRWYMYCYENKICVEFDILVKPAHVCDITVFGSKFSHQYADKLAANVRANI